MTEPQATRSEISYRLEEARKAAGFKSAREAALRNGFPESTYSAHEHGYRNPKKDQVRNYAEAFRVDLHWLQTGEGEMHPHGVPVEVGPGRNAAGIARMTADIGFDTWRQADLEESVVSAFPEVDGISNKKWPHGAQLVSKVVTKPGAALANGSLVVSVPWSMAGRNLVVGDVVILRLQSGRFSQFIVSRCVQASETDVQFEAMDRPNTTLELGGDTDVVTVSALVIASVVILS